MITIAIAQQKGGQGKTTLARNLAYYAAEQGLRVLALDFDPQASFTKKMMVLRERNFQNSRTPKALLASMLFSKAAGKRLPLDCGDNISLIASDLKLLDVAAYSFPRLHLPRQALERFSQDFDLCIIDTAGTRAKPLFSSLITADFAVCPCTIDEEAVEGLIDLFGDVKRVQQNWNADLVLLGVLANCINTRRILDLEGLASMKDNLGGLLLDTVLYERAATKYAKNCAVWQSQRGESHQNAAKEMKAACKLILEKAGL